MMQFCVTSSLNLNALIAKTNVINCLFQMDAKAEHSATLPTEYSFIASNLETSEIDKLKVFEGYLKVHLRVVIGP